MNTDANSVYSRFKKVDCASVKSLTEKQSSGNSGQSKRSNIFTPNTKIHKWVEGVSFLRFLPQPAGSNYGWCVPIDVVEIYDEKAVMQGTFLIGAELENGEQHPKSFKPQMDKIRKMLYNHPEHKLALYSKATPEGFRFTTKCRMLFQGFDVTGSPHTVELFRLPANYKNAGNAPVQCGTRIAGYTTDVDRNGNFKYGDITDIQTGRIVKIDVQNPGKTAATYYPEVEDVLSLMEPAFIPLLESIKSYDEYLKWPTQEEFVQLVSQMIPANERHIWKYVSEQMGWDIKVGENPF